MENQIAIHQNATSEKVDNFLSLERFIESFQEMYNNNNVDGVYYNENGEIEARDIWGDIHQNII